MGGKIDKNKPQYKKDKSRKEKKKTEMKSRGKFVRVSRRTLAILVVVVVAGLVLAGTLQSTIAVPTGFLTLRLNSVNGYEYGSSTGGNNVGVTAAGYFYFPGENGIMWRGYAQFGNVHLVNQTWLGWQRVDNASVSTTEHYFTYDLLAYTVSSVYDIMPTGSASYSATQYRWQRHGIYGDVIASTAGTMSLRYLTIPSNYGARLTTKLDLNVEMELTFHPELFGQGIPLTIDATNGAWNVAQFAVTNVRAQGDPYVEASSGYVTEPTVTYTNSSFSLNVVSESASSGASTEFAGSLNQGDQVAKDGEIRAAMRLKDPSGNFFRIDGTSSVLQASTGEMQSLLQPGMPISLTANNTDGLDYTRAIVRGNVPFRLQPLTTISQTTYSFKKWDVQSYDHLWSAETYDANYVTNPVTYPTLVNTKNVYAIQRVQCCVTVATNYTWTPIAACYDPTLTCYSPDIKAPSINGTNGELNPLPQQYVSAADGSVTGNGVFGDFFGGLFGPIGGIISWIVIGLIVIVVIYVIWRFFPKKSDGGRDKDAVNVYVGQEKTKAKLD